MRDLETAKAPRIYIGCAGWSLPKQHADSFPVEGTHLARYAGRFSVVEINSSFYRPHRPATYARWAESVPDDFRFAVKVPKEITHRRRLVDSAEPLDRFLGEAGMLKASLGPLLVQLPPSLAFDGPLIESFFRLFRARFQGALVCEPRHASWFEAMPDRLLVDFQVARVAADPAVVPLAAEPGGWTGLTYYRLHGSPRMYYSSYTADYLRTLGDGLARRAQLGPAWCIFDNTALGAAQANALELQTYLRAAV